MKPLGGLNKTRQMRENANALRGQEVAATVHPKPNGSIIMALKGAASFIANKKYGNVMSVLLHLVEKEMDSINGDEKLSLRKRFLMLDHCLGSYRAQLLWEYDTKF